MGAPPFGSVDAIASKVILQLKETVLLSSEGFDSSSGISRHHRGKKSDQLLIVMHRKFCHVRTFVVGLE